MKKWIAVFSGAMLIAASGLAQNLDAGTKELLLSGSVDFDTPVGTDLTLDIGLGHFVADNIEVGVLAGISDNDAGTLWRLGAFGELNLPVEGLGVVPFVGAAVLYAYADPKEGSSDDALVGRASAGLKYFLTSDLAIAAQANFEVASEDIYVEEDGKVSDTNWDITLGLRYFFDR